MIRSFPTIGVPTASALAIPVGETFKLTEGDPTASALDIPVGEMVRLAEGVPVASALAMPVGEVFALAEGDPMDSALTIPVGETTALAEGDPSASALEIPVGEAFILTEGEPIAWVLAIPVGETFKLIDGEPTAPALAIPDGETFKLADGEPIAPAVAMPDGETFRLAEGVPSASAVAMPDGKTSRLTTSWFIAIRKPAFSSAVDDGVAVFDPVAAAEACATSAMVVEAIPPGSYRSIIPVGGVNVKDELVSSPPIKTIRVFAVAVVMVGAITFVPAAFPCTPLASMGFDVSTPEKLWIATLTRDVAENPHVYVDPSLLAIFLYTSITAVMVVFMV